MNEKKNEIVLFEEQNVKLKVNVKDDTVWLNREQMSTLFDRDIKTIGKHINNALSEELKDDSSTVAKIATVQKEGNRSVKRNIEYYNLDVIISVGYRVKSKNGVIFRRWANKVLKDYLLKGYAINNKRLEALEKRIDIINIAKRLETNNENYDSNEVLKVIEGYTSALDLINDYDNNTIPKNNKHLDKRIITYDECKNIIKSLKYNTTGSLFGIERDKGLSAILGAVYQSFDGNDLYKTVEEKSANLLYLIVKNHTFLDGNKRIGATLFIYFLNYYGLLFVNGKQIIDNKTLTALTLFVAESKPKEKETIIDLIMSFLDTK